MIRPLAVLLAAALLLGACAGPAATTRPRADSPRVRCLLEPERESATRPLFFLFCLEAP